MESSKKKTESHLYYKTEILKNELNCTACGVFLKIGNHVKKHPLLEVAICFECYSNYEKANFHEKPLCIWCTKENDLKICSTCKASFCKECLKRNLGEKSIEDSKSTCLKCNLEIIFPLRMKFTQAVEHTRKRTLLEEKQECKQPKKRFRSFSFDEKRNTGLNLEEFRDQIKEYHQELRESSPSEKRNLQSFLKNKIEQLICLFGEALIKTDEVRKEPFINQLSQTKEWFRYLLLLIDVVNENLVTIKSDLIRESNRWKNLHGIILTDLDNDTRSHENIKGKDSPDSMVLPQSPSKELNNTCLPSTSKKNIHILSNEVVSPNHITSSPKKKISLSLKEKMRKTPKKRKVISHLLSTTDDSSLDEITAKQFNMNELTDKEKTSDSQAKDILEVEITLEDTQKQKKIEINECNLQENNSEVFSVEQSADKDQENDSVNMNELRDKEKISDSRAKDILEVKNTLEHTQKQKKIEINECNLQENNSEVFIVEQSADKDQENDSANKISGEPSCNKGNETFKTIEELTQQSKDAEENDNVKETSEKTSSEKENEVYNTAEQLTEQNEDAKDDDSIKEISERMLIETENEDCETYETAEELKEQGKQESFCVKEEQEDFSHFSDDTDVGDIQDPDELVTGVKQEKEGSTNIYANLENLVLCEQTGCFIGGMIEDSPDIEEYNINCHSDSLSDAESYIFDLNNLSFKQSDQLFDSQSTIINEFDSPSVEEDNLTEAFGVDVMEQEIEEIDVEMENDIKKMEMNDEYSKEEICALKEVINRSSADSFSVKTEKELGVIKNETEILTNEDTIVQERETKSMQNKEYSTVLFENQDNPVLEKDKTSEQKENDHIENNNDIMEHKRDEDEESVEVNSTEEEGENEKRDSRCKSPLLFISSDEEDIIKESILKLEDVYFSTDLESDSTSFSEEEENSSSPKQSDEKGEDVPGQVVTLPLFEAQKMIESSDTAVDNNFTPDANTECSINENVNSRLDGKSDNLADLDKKFSQKCEVILQRLPEDYLKSKMKSGNHKDDEIAEIDRLTNLNSLKRKQRPSSSDQEKKRNKKRPAKCSSKSSDSSHSESTSLDVSSNEDNENQEYDNWLNAEETEKIHSESFGLASEGLGDVDTELLLDEILQYKLPSSSTEDDDTDIEFTEEEETLENDKKVKKKEVKDSEGSKNKEKENKEKEPGSEWRKDPLLRGKLNFSSDSDTDTEENKNKMPKNKPSNSDSRKKYREEKEDESTDEDIKPVSPNKKDIRNTIFITSSSDLSSDSDIEFISESKSKRKFRRQKNSASDEDNTAKKKGRRNIRAIISDETLEESTKRAIEEDKYRKERISQKQKLMNTVLSQSSQEQEEGLILDMDEETNKPLVVVNSNLSKRLKHHQAEGVKFMWNCCYESIKQIKNGDLGSGCLLAHCMGLGKTFQVITLIHTLFSCEATNTKHVLVVCPLSTVLNWENEFLIAFKVASDQKKIKLFLIGDQIRGPSRKFTIIKQWNKKGGVLIMGYEAYTSFIKENKSTVPDIFAVIKGALVDPGPDLVILDEGHLLKNGKNLRTTSLMKIKTRRRIILTGTPLQNNLKEYYHMVNFVKPNLLGNYLEYTNQFVNPIVNGQYDDSTEEDVRQMKFRSHVLHKKLRGTIQRFEVSELETYLPPKLDYVLFVQLHPIQIELYKQFVNNLLQKDEIRRGRIFSHFRYLQNIWSHPHLLYLEDKINQKLKNKKIKEFDVINLDPEDQETESKPIFDNWWSSFCPKDIDKNIDYGPKFKIALSIIEEAINLGEKVVVFSNSLMELDCIEYFLKLYGTQNRKIWRNKMEYYRMDGTIKPESRMSLCNAFNNPKNVTTKLFLVSHKVGGLGLNFVAANRVILMDVNWNPAYDSQSIFRIYRFGQTKKCYVYRLVSLGTMEEVVYERSVTKLAIAGRVVDERQISRHYKSEELHKMYRANFILDQQRPTLQVPDDVVLGKIYQKHEKELFKYHLHQMLLEDLPHESLTKEEMQHAWEEFNKEVTAKAEKQMQVNSTNGQNKRYSNYQRRMDEGNGLTDPTLLQANPRFYLDDRNIFNQQTLNPNINQYNEMNKIPSNSINRSLTFNFQDAVRRVISAELNNNPLTDGLSNTIETDTNKTTNSAIAQFEHVYIQENENIAKQRTVNNTGSVSAAQQHDRKLLSKMPPLIRRSQLQSKENFPVHQLGKINKQHDVTNDKSVTPGRRDFNESSSSDNSTAVIMPNKEYLEQLQITKAAKQLLQFSKSNVTNMKTLKSTTNINLTNSKQPLKSKVADRTTLANILYANQNEEIPTISLVPNKPSSGLEEYNTNIKKRSEETVITNSVLKKRPEVNAKPVDVIDLQREEQQQLLSLIAQNNDITLTHIINSTEDDTKSLSNSADKNVLQNNLNETVYNSCDNRLETNLSMKNTFSKSQHTEIQFFSGHLLFKHIFQVKAFTYLESMHNFMEHYQKKAFPCKK